MLKYSKRHTELYRKLRTLTAGFREAVHKCWKALVGGLGMLIPSSDPLDPRYFARAISERLMWFARCAPAHVLPVLRRADGDERSASYPLRRTTGARKIIFITGRFIKNRRNDHERLTQRFTYLWVWQMSNPSASEMANEENIDSAQMSARLSWMMGQGHYFVVFHLISSTWVYQPWFVSTSEIY